MTNDPYGTPQQGQPPYGQQPQQPQYGQQSPQYGAPPAYGQPQYGAAQPYGGPGPYGGGLPPLANWGQRVGAYLIDLIVTLPGTVVVIIGYAWLLSSIHAQNQCDTAGYCHTVTNGTASPVALVLVFLGGILSFAIQFWNRWMKGGKGQSIGKRVLNISLISESTGQPIGTGMAFVRDIAHFLDSIACYLGYLWPLWDAKRQTFSDKVMKTVVVQGPPPGQEKR